MRLGESARVWYLDGAPVLGSGLRLWSSALALGSGPWHWSSVLAPAASPDRYQRLSCINCMRMTFPASPLNLKKHAFIPQSLFFLRRSKPPLKSGRLCRLSYRCSIYCVYSVDFGEDPPPRDGESHRIRGLKSHLLAISRASRYRSSSRLHWAGDPARFN